MRLLVCGGAGYIGAHMCKMLAEAGHELLVIDDLSTGHQEALMWGTWIKGSIANAALVDDAFESFRPEAVFHFAARSIVADSISHPATYYQANFSDSLQLIHRLIRTPNCPLIFSSTAAVYGEPQTAKIAEQHPILPINAYGRSKHMVEMALADCWHAHHLSSMSFRYFNAAGADRTGLIGESHQPETHLIPLALAAANGNGRPLKVFGNDYSTADGTCVRDFIHVNDLCRAHLAGLNYLLQHPGHYQFNLGNGMGFSVKQVIAAVAEVTGLRVPHSIAERRPGDPPILIADASAACRMLGWRPEVPALEEIIETAWQWFQAPKY